jgi:hypothetical protein
MAISHAICLEGTMHQKLAAPKGSLFRLCTGGHQAVNVAGAA